MNRLVLNHTLRHSVNWLELGLLLVMIVAFWHHAPHIRDEWVWLLWFAQPVFAARLLLHRRLFTPLALIWLLLPFIALSAWNFGAAPFARSHFIVVVCRPLLGIWLVIYCVEHVRVLRRIEALLFITLGMGLVLGILGLTTTNFEMGKSAAFTDLINALPRFDYRAVVPDMLLGFNPNEIAGAMAWVLPLLAALLAYPSLAYSSLAYPSGKALQHGLRWQRLLLRLGSGATAALLLLALFVGQSRFALAGVLLALLLLVWVLARRWRWRAPLLVGVALLIALQAALFFNLSGEMLLRWLAPTQTEQSEVETHTPPDALGRDEITWQSRLDTWAVAWRMITDHPATGVGMAMFRTAVRTPEYDIIPYYLGNPYGPPHAHNEWLQVGTDLGVPGLLLYTSWLCMTGYMLWRTWRIADRAGQVVAVGVAAGLLAHAVYGLGDAITLWDRYSFVFWWLLGLAAAQYSLTIHASDQPGLE